MSNKNTATAVVDGVIVSQSAGSLMWRDSDTLFQELQTQVFPKETPKALPKRMVPALPEEVFFRNQVIFGTLIPKKFLRPISIFSGELAKEKGISNSDKLKLETGMSFSCNARSNEGVAVGRHIFGSIGRIEKIFVVTLWRLIVLTELGDMYTVFVEGIQSESNAPTTQHASFSLDDVVIPPKLFEGTLFRRNSLQVFRLTGEVWKRLVVGRSGQFKTDRPVVEISPDHHRGVSVGVQAPGVRVGGFVASVHQVSDESAIAVTESGALYFVLVVR
jgi:hypothetical protein